MPRGRERLCALLLFASDVKHGRLLVCVLVAGDSSTNRTLQTRALEVARFRVLKILCSICGVPKFWIRRRRET